MELINRINYFYNILKYAGTDLSHLSDPDFDKYYHLITAFTNMNLISPGEEGYFNKIKKWVKDNNVESFFPFKSLKYDRYLISKFKFNLDVDRISPFQESYDDDTIYVISLVKLNIVEPTNIIEFHGLELNIDYVELNNTDKYYLNNLLLSFLYFYSHL